jgi:hypothetical protein
MLIPQNVQICIYDLQGKKIRVLLDKHLSQGNYKVNFDATGLERGVYFCVMETPTARYSEKLVLVN